MKIEIEISGQRIADLMTTAIESGDPVTTAARGGWCSGINWSGARASVLKRPWYAQPEFWDSDFLIEVTEVDDERTGHETIHRIGPAEMRKGLQLVAEKFGDSFGDILEENDDAGTADIFLQCIVFGDTKYG